MVVWLCMLATVLLAKFFMGTLDSDSSKKRFLIFVGLIVVFVAGSRYATTAGVGDINNYYRLYSRMASISFSELFSSSSMEPGYLLFNKIFSLVLPWTQTIMYAVSAVCVFFSFRFIYKYCSNVFLGVLGYLSQGLFVFNLSGFRQSIAIGICLFAIEFIQKRKCLAFVVTVLIAMSFHSTAIIFLPFYFLSKLQPSPLNLLAYAGLSVLLFNFGPELMSFGSDITGSDYDTAVVKGTLVGPLINTILYALTLLFLGLMNKNKENDSSTKWMWNMTICGLMVYLLRFVSIPFERISFYFSGSTMALLAYGFENVCKTRSVEKNLLNMVYVILSIALYFIRFRTIGYDFFG